MEILFAPASKHPLVFTRPPITCSAANDAFPVQLTGFVWWMQRYLNMPLAHWQIPAPASLFLNVFTTERGRKDEGRDIRQPQNLQRIAGLRSFFTGVSDAPLLFISVRYQQRGARLHTSSPNSTYWFITNYLSRGPESVPCIIAGVTLDNGWMKLSSLYTKWQWHLQKIL